MFPFVHFFNVNENFIHDKLYLENISKRKKVPYNQLIFITFNILKYFILPIQCLKKYVSVIFFKFAFYASFLCLIIWKKILNYIKKRTKLKLKKKKLICKTLMCHLFEKAVSLIQLALFFVLVNYGISAF